MGLKKFNIKLECGWCALKVPKRKKNISNDNYFIIRKCIHHEQARLHKLDCMAFNGPYRFN